MLQNVTSFKELIVWQKGFKLCLLVYKVTGNFPKEEIYTLTAQIRRCCIPIPSNVAEGHARHRRLEYIQFLRIAYGSAAELETQLLLSRELKYIDEEEYIPIMQLLEEVQKMLNSIIGRLKKGL